MKKSVVILIALIYVASIAIVGFLGLEANSYNDVIQVETVKFTNECITSPQTGEKFIVLYAKDGNSIQLNAELTPDNASDKKIIYTLANDCTIATIDENGLLTFNVDGSQAVYSLRAYVYSNQNPTISDEILIYYIP